MLAPIITRSYFSISFFVASLRDIIFAGISLLKNSPILEQIFFVWPSVDE